MTHIGQDPPETVSISFVGGNAGQARLPRQLSLLCGLLMSGALLVLMVLGCIHSVDAKSRSSANSSQNSKQTQEPIEPVALSRFESREWGVTLQYPADYVLKQVNEPAESNSSWMFGRIDDRHSGEIMIATVEIPKELFPGTDLTSAVFGVSANRHLTKDECLAAADAQNGNELHTTKLSGIEFHWSEGGDAPTAAAFREYAGFSNGVCYEIQTVVATTRFGPPEGTTRVDEEDLDRRMGALLDSLKISPQKSAEKIPEIHVFTVEAEPPDANTYRLHWDVTGASEKQLTIDVNCFTDSSLIEVTDARNGASFKCRELKGITPLDGSLNLKIENHTGVTLNPELRLLALGRSPVAQTVKISVPTQAVIQGPSLNGRFVGKVEVTPMYPGVQSGWVGEAFSAHETAWIGATSFAAESPDGRRLDFSVPISLPFGKFLMYFEDARGKSNKVWVNVVRSQPRINFASPAADRASCAEPLVPGQRARVVGIGFTSHSTVFIGTTAVPAEGDPRFPQFGLYFTVPATLKPGSYLLYVSDELGKSNEVAVTVTETH